MINPKLVLQMKKGFFQIGASNQLFNSQAVAYSYDFRDGCTCTIRQAKVLLASSLSTGVVPSQLSLYDNRLSKNRSVFETFETNRML